MKQDRSLRFIVLSRDPNQLTPIVTALESNESGKASATSIFELPINTPFKRYLYIMLTRQYRCYSNII
jgi:superfamily I DNA and/or RNA helicase